MSKLYIRTLHILILLIASISCTSVFAATAVKIAALSPKYDSEEVIVTWDIPLEGGCATSSIATTNPTAKNHKNLIATLLAAFAAGSSVEVVFGGGCNVNNQNWIQTVRIVRQ